MMPSLVRALARGALALALLALPFRLAAQETGSVSGRVFDAETGAVLRGAVVAIAGTTVRATTGADGAYALSAPAGPQTLTVDYLGLPSASRPVTVAAGGAVRLDVELRTGVVRLGDFRVESTRTGQARALNQQRASTNLVSIISSDLSGQFPDKTIADAVKRLPGITVETDRDTGGAEGRYITVRGMTADFNAVTIDGMRVNVTDFDGITRRVPLDVVPSDVADQIEVTKALRPDQDADSIGGAVNIRTRSAFSRRERAATAKAALGYSALLEDYTGGYPYENPGREAAFTFSDLLGADRKVGVSLGGSWRSRAFVKQRNSTTGWNDTAGYRLGTSTTVNPLRGYTMDSFVLQHYFDDIDSTGFTGALEWRPSDAHQFRLSGAVNARDTNRGRQRQVVFFPLGRSSDGSIGGVTAAPTLTGDTYTALSAAGNTVRREVRDFDERQVTRTVALDGESRFGDLKLNYLAGYNWAHWDGGLDSALQAQFQNAGFTTSYQITPGQAPFTTVRAVQTTTGLDRNDPAIAGVYTMRNLVRGSREYWDDEFNAGLDATRPLALGDWSGTWRTGAKVRARQREFDETQRSYNQNASWSLLGYAGQSDVPSLVAPYRANGTSDGRYDYGYFLDPRVVRSVSDLLISRGLLAPLSTNAFNSLYNDYDASEDILAGYAQAQLSRGPVTLLAGVRVERTRTRFETFRVVDGAPQPIAPERTYTDWLPGLHLRYDWTRETVVRASYTEALARPTFNQLNPRETRSTTSDTVSRGNINLRPVYSRNFDASVERYLGSVGALSLGVFHKRYRNNVYRSTVTELFEGDLTRITEPRNARGGELTGVEVALDTSLRVLSPALEGFGATLNYTYTDSSLDSGLAALAGREMPLFDQMPHTVNASLSYARGPFRARAALHHRSETLFELATDNPIALARYEAPSTTVDFTASWTFRRGWSLYLELANLTNEPSRGYNGDESLRLDYNEYTDWSGVLGVRWSL